MSHGRKVQYLTLLNHFIVIAGITWIFLYDQLWYLLIGIFAYLVIGVLSANVSMHRYISHRSFTTSPKKDKFLKYISILCGFGSPISWAALHRRHHATSDKDNDIQNPKVIGVLRSWISLYPDVKINPKLVGDLIRDPTVKFIHSNYFVILFSIYFIVFLIDPILMIFLLSFPAVLCFHGAAAIGVIPHYKQFGYRVVETADDSVNSILASLLSLGEGWHNYHHHKPTDHRHGHLFWEFDPNAWVIEKFFKESVLNGR